MWLLKVFENSSRITSSHICTAEEEKHWYFLAFNCQTCFADILLFLVLSITLYTIYCFKIYAIYHADFVCFPGYSFDTFWICRHIIIFSFSIIHQRYGRIYADNHSQYFCAVCLFLLIEVSQCFFANQIILRNNLSCSLQIYFLILRNCS